jgi:branched-chain amino acid transport system ATP-binding protein
LCDRGYVLETGRMILDGSHDTLMSNAEVQRVYLGH